MDIVRARGAADQSATGAVMNRARSHWWNTSEPYNPSEPLRGDLRVDCCIIGGGITGVSSAYHLKKLDPSISVALLEAEAVGYGASGRNAGQLLVKFGGASLEKTVKLYGAENIGTAWEYGHRGIQLIQSLPAQEGVDCDYAPTGTLTVALKAEGNAHIETTQRFLERIGQARHVAYVDGKRIESELSSPYLGGALHDIRGGQFNPLKLVRCLTQAAERRGVQVFENTPVAHVGIEPTRITVHTGAGSVTCRKLILATNAYTHLLGGAGEMGMTREQTPLVVKAVITEPLTERQWSAAGWPRRCGVNVLSQLFYSFAPTADGRILLVCGYSTSAPTDRALIPEVAWRLKEAGPEHLGAFFPVFKGVTAQTWGGPISITADWIPHIGSTSDPRVVYACGCWGHGMPIGTQNGRTLAELTLERRTENTDLWLVRRSKPQWPGRRLAGLLASAVIFRRRWGNRRIAATLRPPIRFRS
jgi:glycine/D-amino acid oxidase-like deaminating enzyme